ncbi:hypothetical protein K435DRAFT_797343 [Dendrothele bispora CBS 962.96]|uniref:Uncharacterized protein n=1 Tax=Dendrothele bispora (strain CBS 962.96) TaxID=1314807 RepID=A0A4S8M3A0_DENBC|nr:hypothetical protein K435DRAFT_797343 [Dendrothele bispora CBS 962.96]
MLITTPGTDLVPATSDVDPVSNTPSTAASTAVPAAPGLNADSLTAVPAPGSDSTSTSFANPVCTPIPAAADDPIPNTSPGPNANPNTGADPVPFTSTDPTPAAPPPSTIPLRRSNRKAAADENHTLQQSVQLIKNVDTNDNPPM